jgi:LysM repeat protein
VVHVVQSGETLPRISEKYGVSMKSIINANYIAKPNILSVARC